MCVPLRHFSEKSLFVDAIYISVGQTAVFHLKNAWYCDETTITLIGFLKVGQVSESSECKAKPRRTHSLRLYSFLVDFASALLRFAQVCYYTPYPITRPFFWRTCPLFSWEMKYYLRIFETVILFAFLFYIAIISGVTRALSQGGKLSQKGPTGHCTGPTSQHSKKTWERWWIRMWIAMLKP